MTQQHHGRRGSVFSVRVTDEEREQLEAAQRADAGPRALGPWMKWKALRGTGGPPPGQALPGARIILDLCGGSGSWSAPYVAAGYDVRRVTLPELDVRTYVPPARVWGILAAPPCEQFSAARNASKTPRDYVAGMATVNACMRIILQARPRWWALENPATGQLARFLGTPRDAWEPCDFGDPWTKRTAIWGEYVLPVRGPFVAPLGAGPLCTVCDPSLRQSTNCNSSAHRAVTPPGFARAFFAANP